MSADVDLYAEWDAAYVLGALSPEDRRAYEDHLAGCAACRSAVAELAGVPGLLAKLPPEEAALLVAAEPVPPDGGAPVDEPPPPTLLPGALRIARARRRRRALGMLAVAAAVLVVLGGVVTLGLRGAHGPQHVGFAQVTPSTLIAVADLVPIAGGTEVRVQCAYGEEGDPRSDTEGVYAIDVVDRFGNREQVKDWPVRPNKLMRPTGTTSWPISRISEVEIRKGGGEVVLRARVG